MYQVNPPSSFAKNEQLSQMSFAPNVPGISTGNAMIDQLVSMLMSGQNMGARPHIGQSALEAHLQRQRSTEYLQTMRQQFGSSAVFQKFGGINPNQEFGSLVSTFFGNPDGISNNPLMRAFNGGNPVKAAMALQSNMTGYSQYMNTGSWENASVRGVNNVMEGATRAFYNSKVYTASDAAMARNNESSKMMDFINKDPNRRMRFEDVITKDANGNEQFNFEEATKIRQAAAKGASGKMSAMGKLMADEAAKVMEATNTVNLTKGRVGLNTPTSVNFEMSRGFELQDLTKSYSMSRDLGLFNERAAMDAAYRGMGTTDANATYEQKNKATTDVTQGYFRRAGRISNAVSDLTGAKTAEEATSQLNDILGSSQINASGSEENAKYVEDLLRRVKGVARTAGISIDAMMGMVAEGKSMASRYASLENMGGVSALESTMTSFRRTQVLGVSMGSDLVRRHGGIVGLGREIQAMDKESSAHQASSGAYALRAHIEASGASDSAKLAMKEYLLQDANDVSADRSPAGRNRYFEKLSQMGGGNIMELRYASENQSLAEAGRFMAEKDKTGTGKHYNFDAAGTNHRFAFDIANVQAQVGDKINSAEGILNSKGERMTSTQEAMREFQNDMMGIRHSATLNSPELVLAKYGANANKWYSDPAEAKKAEMRLMTTIMSNDPEVVKKHRELQTVINRYAKEEAVTAERSARLRVPIGTALAQEVMQNGLSRGFDGLMSVLGEDGGTRARVLAEATGKATTEGSAESIMGALWEQHGGKIGENADKVVKNLKAQGKSDAQVMDALQKRGNLYSEVDGSLYWNDEKEMFKSFDSLAEKGLTTEQILAAAPDGDKGRSEDAFKKSKAAELGAEFNDVYQTSMWLRKTGFIDSKAQKARYGKEQFNRKLFGQMVAEGSVMEMSAMDLAAAEAYVPQTSLNKINDLLGSLNDPHLTGAMEKAGYLKNGKLDANAIKHGAGDQFGGELGQLLGTYSLKDGGLDMTKLTEAVTGVPKDPVLAKMLQAGGFLEMGDGGKVTSVNAEKLKKAKAQDEANKAIAAHPNGGELSAELSGIHADYEAQKSQANSMANAVGQGKPGTEQEDAKAAQGASILKTLESIAKALADIAK